MLQKKSCHRRAFHDSTSRSAILVGGIMGTAYPNKISFVQNMWAYSSIQQEIKDLVDSTIKKFDE
jgi:dissimilatory sulfite reductase (desulfoviridin) alpha/beta subunit